MQILTSVALIPYVHSHKQFEGGRGGVTGEIAAFTGTPCNEEMHSDAHTPPHLQCSLPLLKVQSAAALGVGGLAQAQCVLTSVWSGAEAGALSGSLSLSIVSSRTMRSG